jgi:hypothetical protein
MPGIPQYSESINDVPITQELFTPVFAEGESTKEYCTGYFPTLIQINSLYLNAQKISWTEDPNIEKHTAPGRDGDILHHLGWHSRSVKIDSEIAGTSAGDVIATLHQMSRTKAPVTLTISTLIDRSINGQYVIESFAPSSSTKNPVNVADYSIALLSHTAITACRASAAVSGGSSRKKGSYTDDPTEGCTWCRNCDDSSACASTNMMQSCSNLMENSWGAECCEAIADYKIVSTFSSTDPLTKWAQSNLGNSSRIVMQQFSKGYLAYNRENNRIGWLNNGALPSVGPEYEIPQTHFDDSAWNIVCQWNKEKIEVYKIENWEVSTGVELDLDGDWIRQ